MQHQIHPDDERLSALAGGDPEAAGDAALRAHLEGCERCTSLVRELGELRVSLAQLPDLPPSRPLQLVPPVPEPAASGAGGGWLRRLAAPAMAAGIAMAVIGGVGFGATALSGLGAASGAAPANEDAQQPPVPETPALLDGGEVTSGDSTSRGGFHAASASPRASLDLAEGGATPRARASAAEAPEEDGRDEGASEDFAAIAVDFNRPGPWLVVLGGGVLLLLAGMALRHSVQPRAG